MKPLLTLIVFFCAAGTFFAYRHFQTDADYKIFEEYFSSPREVKDLEVEHFSWQGANSLTLTFQASENVVLKLPVRLEPVQIDIGLLNFLLQKFPAKTELINNTDLSCNKWEGQFAESKIYSLLICHHVKTNTYFLHSNSGT